MDRISLQDQFELIGKSPAFLQVLDRLKLVAPTDISVLIEGEIGTGKEKIAEALHGISLRKNKALIIVNCGAIPEGLLETELFGYEKGYMGALEGQAGYFEAANGGTVFLDEIGEMPLNVQARLLRVLDTGDFSRVGSGKMHQTDVRIIATTHRNLASEVENGRFREDLYYRLSTVVLHLPPLRERREDILPLFDFFIRKSAKRYQAPIKTLHPEAAHLLMQYRFPGNIRELKNIAEEALVLTKTSEIRLPQIQPLLRNIEVGEVGFLRENDTLRAERDMLRRMVEVLLEKQGLKPDLSTTYPQGIPTTALPSSPTLALPEPEYVQAEWVEPANAIPQQKWTKVEQLPTFAEMEEALIREALRRFQHNRRKTAEALGISERTLYRKIQEFDIEEEFR